MAGRTEPHFSPRALKLRACERIERASIIFSGGALFLAVERASSLSRAEAASHGPSVMACRDPAPAQMPRYREERVHTRCMPLQIRATLRVWDSVARYQLYISGPVCVNPDGGICAAILHPSATDWAYACFV